MRLEDIYDSEGLHGKWNKEAYDKMPNMLRYFIDSTQKLITDKVVRKVKEKYGENGVRCLVKTSGFRSNKTNIACGGVVDSLHLFGCAVDFAKNGIFEKEPIPVCCNLQCIDSGRCWHVQLMRVN